MLTKAIKLRREHNRIRRILHIPAVEMKMLVRRNPIPSFTDVRAASRLSTTPKSEQRHLFKQYICRPKERSLIPQNELVQRREQFRIDVLTGHHTDIDGWPALTVTQKALVDAGFDGFKLESDVRQMEIPLQPPVINGAITASAGLHSHLGMPTHSELARIRSTAYGDGKDKLLEIITPGDDPDEFDASDMMAMGISPSEAQLVQSTQDDDEVELDEDPAEVDEDDADREDPAEDRYDAKE